MSLYIFDLDGTLALIDHRRHYVERPSRKCCLCSGKNPGCVECADMDAGWRADWPAFYAACSEDKPNVPVIQTLRALQRAGAEVRVWSGRSDEVREATLDWLWEHVGLRLTTLTRKIAVQMRPKGDYTPDVELKRAWLAALPSQDRARLVAVFDDRDSVVKMWREEGVACFQVASGDF